MAKHLTRRQYTWHTAMPLTKKVLREERWRKQVFGVLRFLGELRNSPELGGEKWKRGMFAYYGKKANALLAEVPSGLESEAADFQRKLDRCKISQQDD